MRCRILLELVEHLGSGIGKILKSYKESIYEISDNLIRVIIPFETPFESPKKSTEKSTEKILKLIAQNSKITIKELTNELGISQSAIEKNISKLKDENKLKRIGADKGGYWEVIE